MINTNRARKYDEDVDYEPPKTKKIKKNNNIHNRTSTSKSIQLSNKERIERLKKKTLRGSNEVYSAKFNSNSEKNHLPSYKVPVPTEIEIRNHDDFFEENFSSNYSEKSIESVIVASSIESPPTNVAFDRPVIHLNEENSSMSNLSNNIQNENSLIMRKLCELEAMMIVMQKQMARIEAKSNQTRNSNGNLFRNEDIPPIDVRFALLEMQLPAQKKDLVDNLEFNLTNYEYQQNLVSKLK